VLQLLSREQLLLRMLRLLSRCQLLRMLQLLSWCRLLA